MEALLGVAILQSICLAGASIGAISVTVSIGDVAWAAAESQPTPCPDQRWRLTKVEC